MAAMALAIFSPVFVSISLLRSMAFVDILYENVVFAFSHVVPDNAVLLEFV